MGGQDIYSQKAGCPEAWTGWEITTKTSALGILMESLLSRWFFLDAQGPEGPNSCSVSLIQASKSVQSLDYTAGLVVGFQEPLQRGCCQKQNAEGRLTRSNPHLGHGFPSRLWVPMSSSVKWGSSPDPRPPNLLQRVMVIKYTDK